MPAPLDPSSDREPTFTREVDPTLAAVEHQLIERRAFADPTTWMLGRHGWLIGGLVCAALLLWEIYGVATEGLASITEAPLHQNIILAALVFWIMPDFCKQFARWTRSGFRTVLPPGPAIIGYSKGREVTRLRRDGLHREMDRYREAIRWAAITRIFAEGGRLYFMCGRGSAANTTYGLAASECCG